MKSQFRATSPEDAPAVAAFLRRIFQVDASLPLTDPKNLYWKSWAPRDDWPGSRGFIMTREEEIVAHGTVVPLHCADGARRLKMAHLIDWAADPKVVGAGVTLLKQIARDLDGVLVVGGSEMTQKVLPALGFKPSGEVTNFVRPLRPLRRAAGEAPSARLAAQVARSALWSFQAPSISTKGWSARRVLPAQLSSEPIPWPHPARGAAVFERTAESVAYLLQCPVAEVELFAVENAVLRGYFLLAHAPGQVRVVDFFVDSEVDADWRVAVQLAVKQAGENRDAAEVVSVASDPVVRQALTDCGFHPRTSFEARVLMAKGVDAPALPLRIQMCDSDAAYLHANRPEYWG
jgi:hypothetical protein